MVLKTSVARREKSKLLPCFRAVFTREAAFLQLFHAGHFQEECEQILVKLLGDPIYAAKFLEEYLDKILKEKSESGKRYNK